MSDIAISVDQLGKWFNTSYRPNGLRETLVSRFKGEAPENGFWALKDISFEVPKGEVFGIIGHNGAGKSVLLKILAGITDPTEGQARIEGRIGALLELGTGFHMELSGRDNIFLNGSFLGMRPWEIEGKLEEIIDFSGIRHAINEPVKHYSSGMTMRLAFSIAVTLAPEVIFLDEVWAVGDMDFQKKAFQKIREIISDGRTVMIVSHSLDTVSSVTTSCVLLDHGRMVDQGASRDIIRSYLAAAARPAGVPLVPKKKPVEKAEEPPKAETQPEAKEESAQTVGQETVTQEENVEPEPVADDISDASETAALFDEDVDEEVNAVDDVSEEEMEEEVAYHMPDLERGRWIWPSHMAPGSDRIRLREIRLINEEGLLAEECFIGESITLEIYYDKSDPKETFMFGVGVQDLYDSYIMANHSETESNKGSKQSEAGLCCARVTIPGKICSMTYRLSIIIGGEENFKFDPDILLTDMIRFNVLPKFYDDQYPLNFSGAIPLDLKWEFEAAQNQAEEAA